jgi:hypothetical protein
MKSWIVRFSPYTCHTSQSIVVKEGKKDRAVWDKSTKLYPLEIVMAEVTPIEFETEIDFRESKMRCKFKFTTYALTSRLP